MTETLTHIINDLSVFMLNSKKKKMCVYVYINNFMRYQIIILTYKKKKIKLLFIKNALY